MHVDYEGPFPARQHGHQERNGPRSLQGLESVGVLRQVFYAAEHLYERKNVIIGAHF